MALQSSPYSAVAEGTSSQADWLNLAPALRYVDLDIATDLGAASRAVR